MRLAPSPQLQVSPEPITKDFGIAMGATKLVRGAVVTDSVNLLEIEREHGETER